MQKNDVIEFLNKIDCYIKDKLSHNLNGKRFELKIIGKSALLIAGLSDPVGTVDIDTLSVDNHTEPNLDKLVVDRLKEEFGRSRIAVNSYYLEFVPQGLVFLPQRPKWISLRSEFSHLLVQTLDPNFIIASKLFSAFSKPHRKKDKQDITASLDQKLVTLQEVLKIADEIFDSHSMDARADRFPFVYQYIMKDLIPNYGPGTINYIPE
jgi:hypothetical protein